MSPQKKKENNNNNLCTTRPALLVKIWCKNASASQKWYGHCSTIAHFQDETFFLNQTFGNYNAIEQFSRADAWFRNPFEWNSRTADSSLTERMAFSNRKRLAQIKKRDKKLARIIGDFDAHNLQNRYVRAKRIAVASQQQLSSCDWQLNSRSRVINFHCIFYSLCCLS